MPIPGFFVTEEELSLSFPRETALIVAGVGPATKGIPNQRGQFAAEPNFVTQFGKPVDRMHGPRAGIRYLRQGNLFDYVRIAGTLLRFGWLDLYAGGTKILTFSGASAGTWVNGVVSIGVTQNSATSYNIQVYDAGRPVPGENFTNVTNGDIATRINGISQYVTVAVAAGAGTTAPDETRDIVTGAISPQSLAGGDDGAFASTRSEDSSTGGIAGRRFFGLTDSVAGSRTFFNHATIDAAIAGATEYRSTLAMPVQPGSFYIRVQTAGGPTYAELTDDEGDVLASGMAQNAVGLLRDTTSTHRGFINYRTGQFGVQLIGGPTLFLTGTIDVIYIRGRADSVGTQLAGQDTYAGALASPDVCPSGISTGRVQLQFTADDKVSTDSGAGGAQHDSADANAQVMDGFIVPGTVQVTAPTAGGTQTVYDDGFGSWRTAADGGGLAVVGTLNYRTGDWDITFPSSVPANSEIDAEYQFIVSDMGTGAVADTGGSYIDTDVVCTSATGGAPQIDSADANCAPLATVPVIPSTVRFVASGIAAGGPETVYDDGVGGLCTLRRGDPGAVDVVGTIDYATGAWDITWSGNVDAAATITASYVAVAESLNVHDLRGSADRMDLSDAATGNDFLTESWLNYVTGSFQVTFVLSATRDLVNNAVIYGVYQHGEILGWGDGTTVAFSGDVADAPIRRESNRMLAFQSAQQALPVAGEAQVAFATTGPPDFWDQNVGGGAAANPVNFATGVTAIQWTGAPINGEATFVVSEEVVGHVTSQFGGDIGNERAIITDGLLPILDVSPSDATKLRFRVMFNNGSGSVAVESWDLLDDFADVLASVNATDGTGSELVTIEDTGAGTEPDPVTQNLGMDGAFTNADVVGAKIGPTYTGLQLYSNPDIVAVDVISAPGQWHRQIQDAGIALCASQGRRALWDYSLPDFTPPDQMDDPLPGVLSTDLAQDAVDFVNGSYNAAIAGGVARPSPKIPYPPLATVNSDYATCHAFWINYFDQYANKDVWEGPEGDFTQLAAKTDRDQERWFPVAGLSRGQLADVNTIRYSPDTADRTIMYDIVGTTQNVVNPIRFKTGVGIWIDGQRTMYRQTSVRDRTNVRLLLNRLENLLEIANFRYEHELNDPILWRQIEATGRLIIRPMIARRGLTDAEVICDSSTNTPDVISQNKAVARLMIQPTLSAERIEYNIIIVPTGVSFEEVLL